jgi:hypothetical protein
VLEDSPQLFKWSVGNINVKLTSVTPSSKANTTHSYKPTILDKAFDVKI